MKWRAERSAGSHRFHCAILWPPSSCFIIQNMHTPTRAPTYLWMSGNSPAVVNYWSTKGKGGLMNGWMNPGNVGLMSPHPSQCVGMSAVLSLLNLWSLSKVYRSLQSLFNTELQWTVSQSSVIFEFNFKRSTRRFWGEEARITLMWNFFLLGKGRKREDPAQNGASFFMELLLKTCWASPFYPHTPTTFWKKSTCVTFRYVYLRSLFVEWTS